MELKDKIKLKLDEYLEFDSDLLFRLEKPSDNNKLQIKTLIRVFGGAIRDIIADMPINDVDILVGAKTYKRLYSILESNGYKNMKILSPKDLSSVYSDIRIINEPHTWIKGHKVIQIIRPVINTYYRKSYEEGFVNLIQNVDISCCGISYDGNRVYENYPNAISHSLCKSFKCNESAKMYSEKRFLHRKYKLMDRGWSEIDSISESRDFKINSILGEDKKLEYIKEYEDIKEIDSIITKTWQ
jgi:predicted nucleotidyltransferase